MYAQSDSEIQPVEKKGIESTIDFKFFGNIESYYKNQDDYHTPLKSSVRSGSNNRSKQTTRTKSIVSFIGKAGKKYSERNSEFIGVFQLSADADDPDQDEDSDGERKTVVDNAELWIRYAPFEAVGIKIGAQSIKATSTAASVYQYKGDFDHDFIFYTAASLVEKPGISIDFHLSEDFEIGIAQIEGMGDGSRIATQGKSSEAKNTVYWLKGKMGTVEFGVAQQSIEVGGSEEESDPDITHWKQEYKHVISNAYVKAKMGPVTPYLGYQTLSGDIAAGNYAGNEVAATFLTAGILADIAGGRFALDYTKTDTPEYGEDKSVWAIVELDSIVQFNYTYPVSENGTIGFFYHMLKSKTDDKRKTTEANARAAGQTTTAASLDSLEWTDTTSIGLQLQLKFKGI